MVKKSINIKLVAKLCGLLVAIFLTYSAICPPANAEVPVVELTDSERSWLADHPVIRVHNEVDWPPFNFAIDGRPQGLSIEYMNLLAERLGIRVEYITGPSWNEFLQMLKTKELDVMLNIVKTKERQEYILYTSPYFRNPNVIVSLSSSSDQYYRTEDLNGKTVAVPKGFYTEEVLRNKFPEIKVLPVKDVLETLKAVIQGKADATIGEVSVVQDVIARYMLNGLQLSVDLELGDPDLVNLRIGVRKDWPVLQSVLTKAMESITPAEMNRIRQKWVIETGQKSYQVVLSSDEKRWLAEHPKIVVGSETDWPPFDFVDKKRVTGYSNELLRLAARKAGLPLEFISGYTWTQLLDKFQKKEIDILPAVFRIPEREHFMSFTQSYMTNPSVLVAHEDSNIRTLKDLVGKKVAIIEAFSTAQIMWERYPEIEQLPVSSVLEGLKAVSLKKADAFIGSMGVISYHLKTNVIPYVRIVDEVWLLKPDETRLHMATLNEQEILRNILQKGLDAVSATEKNALRQEWLAEATFSADEAEESQKIDLTSQEEYFVNSHEPLVFSEVPWEPLSIVKNEDQFDGIIADYLNTVTEKTGLEFKFVASDSRADVLEKYAKGEIDVIPALARNDTVGRDFLVSEQYVSFPLVIVTRSEVNYITNTKELNGKKVAVGKGYASFQYLHDNYPEINLVEADDVEKGLIMLSNGEVFAFVGHLAVAANHIQKLGLTNLKISGETGFKFDHRIGVDPKYPEAASIINKVLTSMTEAEHQVIYQKWLGVKYEKSIDYGLIWKILIGAVLVLAVILYWNRKLFIEIENRKKIEQKLQFTQYAMDKAVYSIFWINPDTTLFTYTNDAACNSLEYSREELLSMQVTQVNIDFSRERLQQFIDDLHQKDFVVIESRHQTKSGQILDVELTCYITDFGGQETIVALAKDITEQKRMMAALQESEEYSRLLLESVGEGITGIDNTGKIIFANPAAVNMLEYSEEELVGQSWHDIVQHSMKDGSPYPLKDSPVYRSFTAGAISHGHEDVLWRRDGGHFPVSCTATPIMKNDEVMGAMVTFRDITDRKLSDEALKKRLNELTEARLSMLNMMEDLEDTKKEAENRNIELDAEVTERKKMEEELRLNMEDLEKFSAMAVGREDKMIELKKEINELLAQTGRDKKYKIVQ